MGAASGSSSRWLEFSSPASRSPFVADFACADARLIIEVDGGQHAESQEDARRDRVLNDIGWRVLRFWNNDVLANTEGVLATILAALGPHPIPPPR